MKKQKRNCFLAAVLTATMIFGQTGAALANEGAADAAAITETVTEVMPEEAAADVLSDLLAERAACCYAAKFSCAALRIKYGFPAVLGAWSGLNHRILLAERYRYLQQFSRV